MIVIAGLILMIGGLLACHVGVCAYDAAQARKKTPRRTASSVSPDDVSEVWRSWQNQ